MEELNLEGELLEMREQLRNIKQQVDKHTTYHEENLRKSIRKNTLFFKGVRIVGYVCCALMSAMLIALIVRLCVVQIWNAWLIVLLLLNLVTTVAAFWGMRYQDRRFELHRLNELDLLTAQTKIEEYKAYTRRQQRIIQPIAIVLLIVMLTYYYVKDPSSFLHTIEPVILAIIVVAPLMLMMKKSIRSLSADIAELRAMEE